MITNNGFLKQNNLGEITVKAPLTDSSVANTFALYVRAYDLGVPHLYSESVVDIYTQSVTPRTIEFIVPKKMDMNDPESKSLEALLSLLTGAPTIIKNIKLYDDTRYVNQPLLRRLKKNKRK